LCKPFFFLLLDSAFGSLFCEADWLDDWELPVAGVAAACEACAGGAG